MQKTIVTCDKCGKDISFDEVNQRFKISVMTRLYAPKSAYIDVCNECMKQFFEGLELHYFEDFSRELDIDSVITTETEVLVGHKKHRKKGKKDGKKNEKH